MPFDTKQLMKKLQEAAKLAAETAQERIPLPDFVERYDNFYYAAALDGHEKDPDVTAVITTEPDLVRLHHDIQRQVVDALYQGPMNDVEALNKVQRIGVDEALQRLKSIVKQYSIKT